MSKSIAKVLAFSTIAIALISGFVATIRLPTEAVLASAFALAAAWLVLSWVRLSWAWVVLAMAALAASTGAVAALAETGWTGVGWAALAVLAGLIWVALAGSAANERINRHFADRDEATKPHHQDTGGGTGPS